MKYKLLKKIDGIDWEVGEIKTSDTDNVVVDTKGSYIHPVDIHNLLLNGTIEKVEENTRWRAKTGELFFSVVFDWFSGVDVAALKEYLEDDESETYYQQGNYFQTKEQAQKVADKIKQLLRESHE